VKEVVTYVEMTAPEQLVASVPVPGLVLEPLDRNSPLVPDILARVGAPYGWKSSSRSPEQWATWLSENPKRTFWLLSFESAPAGIVTCDPHSGEDVEIKSFGLLPEFVGKGLGGYALTLAIQRAWALTSEVMRVWLHTSSFDHPNALPNYHRRGFRTFQTLENERT
jgi:GNAT superfamily N-acetyltransferase